MSSKDKVLNLYSERLSTSNYTRRELYNRGRNICKGPRIEDKRDVLQDSRLGCCEQEGKWYEMRQERWVRSYPGVGTWCVQDFSFCAITVEKHWRLLIKEDKGSYLQYDKITHCSVETDKERDESDKVRSEVEGKDDVGFRPQVVMLDMENNALI
jgi:hypothetical protein